MKGCNISPVVFTTLTLAVFLAFLPGRCDAAGGDGTEDGARPGSPICSPTSSRSKFASLLGSSPMRHIQNRHDCLSLGNGEQGGNYACEIDTNPLSLAEREGGGISGGGTTTVLYGICDRAGFARTRVGPKQHNCMA